MTRSFRVCAATCLGVAALWACRPKPVARPAATPTPALAPAAAAVAIQGSLRIAADVAARRARFVPQTLAADTGGLKAGDRAAIEHLVRATRLVGAIFQRQACPGVEQLAPRVAALTGPDAQAANDYFRIMMGPWDRLNGSEPFIGTAPRPAGAAFYPEDMSREEFESWLAAHPGDRTRFTSPLTVIRRRGSELVAVPYSEEYRDLLTQAATELRAAADATSDARLKKFLTMRADAFLSDDYLASDLAWVDLDGPVEAAIGPFETTEDGLLGRKAAFEAFICIVQKSDSEQLARFKEQLPFLESRLPIPDAMKNTKRGKESAIRLADEVITGGGARRGVQAMAFDLPKDERVREAKGTKKVLLKNVIRARFGAILLPVAARVLVQEEAVNVSFDSYFHHILFHELSHALGPSRITLAGRETEVRQELKDLYLAVEEAKADVLGVYALAVLTNRGVVPVTVVSPLPWTYLAGLFRAARFGAGDAHGMAVVIQANYLLSKGALEVTPAGRFRPVLTKFASGIRDLAHELLTIEAEGSYAGAQELVRKYGTVQPAMAGVLDALSDVPVDVDPVFAAEAGVR